MKIFFSFFLVVAVFTSCFAQDVADKNNAQKTWTYTYIKAKENQKEHLRQYLEKNWFVMDSIAVQQGLFNDFQLLENTHTGSSSDWDFIVAVEYFTQNTYADIQENWLKIRQNHQKVLIDGKDLMDLGQIIKSEELIKHFYLPARGID